MPQSKRLNYYGFFGLWVALISLASYFVLFTRSCVEKDYEQLEYIELLGTLAGSLICLVSFFNTAERLYNRKCIFYSIVSAITIFGFLMLYGSFKAIVQSCTIQSGYERNFEILRNTTINKRFKFDETEVDNWFQRKYGHNIVLFVFNFGSALLFWVIAYMFRRRL